jgi:hypothetical protein
MTGFRPTVRLKSMAWYIGAAVMVLALAASPSTAQTATDPQPAQPVSGDPAALSQCTAAWRAGGAQLDSYYGSLPTAQLQAMCYAAAALGEASCHGFCYARFLR